MNFSADLALSWALPIVATLGVLWLLTFAIRRFIPARYMRRVSRQLLQLLVVVVAIVALVLTLPIDNDTQGQLLSLFGLVLTGVIGLASTSFVSNAMAGFMLRSVASFHGGDFIRVGDFFGRVTETALFHTEIQNEERDLITLPNMYLITHPVEVVRSNGTLISADVSLGYDVQRRRVRDLLIEAATDIELTDAFVQITQLGDYSVNYRVSAFLHDVSKLVSKRSSLRGNMLDKLHESGIEIVSPTFMNQRPLDPSMTMIPKPHRKYESDDEDSGQAEKLMFDKAELAGRIKQMTDQRDKLTEEVRQLKANPETKDYEVSWRQRQIELLEEILGTLVVKEDI